MRVLRDKFLAAMIAVRALPGSPDYGGDDHLIVERALDDLENYNRAGVDAILLENSHDLPYVKAPLDRLAIDVMTQTAISVRREFDGPIGIQMLEAANVTALEIADEADLDFVRVEAYVFAHVGGAGLIEACAGQLLRRRKALGCEHIRILADVHKKHCSHALKGDLSIIDEVKQAEFFKVDGIVVTGAMTTEPPDAAELARVSKSASVPVVVGSGMTATNIATYLPLADGFIVGSTFRLGGRFLEVLDPARLDEFMGTFTVLREAGTGDSAAGGDRG